MRASETPSERGVAWGDRERQPAAPFDVRWAKVVDHTKCIGCHACSTACKSENAVPLGVHRTYVKSVDVGTFPNVRRAFQVTRCNQCESAPCTYACPTSAMFTRKDGIVDFDKSICIGCKACMAACPYDAIFINPEDDAAEKCNFCAHRLDVGLEPACVVVCPTEAIIVGDIADPVSKIARIVGREPVAVRRPEKDTRPKLFYKGAHEATLDPLAARRPPGGLFMWSEQGRVAGGATVTSGTPGRPNSSAAALLSYDVPHQAPWGQLVSLYTWTKGIAAGAYLIAALLLLLGHTGPLGMMFRLAAPALGLLFLLATAALLVADLKRPRRFYLIFTRPQWRSWLVRGGFILLAYGAFLTAHIGAGLAGALGVQKALCAAGIPLSVLTAVYTAYLFAQAKARDLWQSPLLPPHFLVQAGVCGAAALLPVALAWEPWALDAIAVVLAASSALHLLLVLGEVTLSHPTAHARIALAEMTGGAYRHYFRIGAALSALGCLAPWIGIGATPFALAGILAFEHAHVQAGQAVPLA